MNGIVKTSGSVNLTNQLVLYGVLGWSHSNSTSTSPTGRTAASHKDVFTITSNSNNTIIWTAVQNCTIQIWIGGKGAIRNGSGGQGDLITYTVKKGSTTIYSGSLGVTGTNTISTGSQGLSITCSKNDQITWTASISTGSSGSHGAGCSCCIMAKLVS